jgi:subtilisin-like proprotein convertase family protein
MKNIALLTIAALAGTAAAQSYNGSGFSIPDNNPAGASSSIVVADSGNLVDLNVTLNTMAHTWVGDLIIRLSNGSTTVDLINRPGVPELGTVGYSWNLLGNYTFDDAAGTTFESIGNGVGSAFNLASGSYAPEQALAAFNGQSLAGTWTLSISDNAGLDLGSLGSWTLTATVPAPTSLALLGLGGLVAGRRRR